MRIGVTQRIAPATGYAEDRDALAHDWPRFLAAAIPDARWMVLPNIGPAIEDYIRQWHLNAFILTGGNDIGSCPQRDDTERAIVELATVQRHPVFGVCRGLQFLQHHFGGPVRACTRERHVATRHVVTLLAPNRRPEHRLVNSFHAQGVVAEELAPSLYLMGCSPDGLAEAVVHRELPFLAVQWHPEREKIANPDDVALLRQALGLSPHPTIQRPEDSDTLFLPATTPVAENFSQ